MALSFQSRGDKIRLNLAIVGGGRACRFFLEMLQKESFPYLDIHIVGVCDIDPDAEGFQLAREMGLFTTSTYKDLFDIKHLDSIIELTNSRKVLLELIQQRPPNIGIIEHNIGRLLRSYFQTDQQVKSLERQLLLEKMSSDILIQHSSAAIVVLNTDFTIVEANEAFLKKVRKSKKEVVGAYCFEISHGLGSPCPNSRPDLQCPMIESLRTGQSSHVIHEMSGTGFDGTYGVIVTYPLIDALGKIIRIIEIWHDVSEEMESRWDQRYKKLKSEFNNLLKEDRMISLGKLAAGCVHEINNPIQGLLTFTGLMQSSLNKGELDAEEIAEFKKYLGLMSTELERCGRIVTGLLAFSREKTLQYQKIDVNEIIQSVISLTLHNLELRGIELQTEISSLPLMITGDTSRLQQCLLNLIFNAIEAMPEGGVLSLTSKLDDINRQIIVEIQDTGRGIEKGNLERIFEPFFTTKTDGQGTGLGLPIVYNVVKAHFGDIKVDSRPDQGCRFSLMFPPAESDTKKKV